MNSETLLIVEDNHALREGLREMLAIEGFRVHTAFNGREALRVMGNITPDLILSDITMPEMDGFSFFSEVRARQDWVTIPFIFLTARSEREDVLAGKTLGVEDYLIKPLSRDELVTAVRSRLARARQIQFAQLHQATEDTMTILANAIDLRDSYTGRHVERVRGFSVEIASILGWREGALDPLRFGAILHDIGKIFVDERVLRKTDKLTEFEWEEIKRHPVAGAEMIKNIPALAAAVPIIRHHHERWNGSGYPNGLAREQIPAGARIVALTDSFDAMTTTRPYSPGRTQEEAYAEIQRCSGLLFDPAVVDAFQQAWEQGAIQAVSARHPR
jgi:putative two-component system response regulator